MNCPSHVLIYASRRRSYRELPLRIFDQGILHRNEPAGALGGLTRVRQFCQDDAHIFIAEDMIGDEIARVIRMVKRIYEVFGMPTRVFLSTRPEKAMGEKALWDHAEDELRKAIVANDLTYKLNEGDGAFYGPKIDFIVQDALAREHQTATIQLDFQMPMRFGVKYIDTSGEEKTPVMVHRAIFGSFERFMAVLIEHYGGVFPTWLAPVQCAVLTISDKSTEYAKRVHEDLVKAGFRSELDVSDEKINAKIRSAETLKIPYMVVVGEREAANGTVALRAHGRKDLGVMTEAEFHTHLKAEVDSGGF
jgi:threonyl-tRNA synthetase